MPVNLSAKLATAYSAGTAPAEIPLLRQLYGLYIATSNLQSSYHIYGAWKYNFSDHLVVHMIMHDPLDFSLNGESACTLATVYAQHSMESYKISGHVCISCCTIRMVPITRLQD